MNNPSTSPSLALYGGSFDPVHRAHLNVARAALEKAGVDRVIFIPAAHSPLKPDAPLASEADRVEMLRLATAGVARFEVDACEVERGGTSFTVDTVVLFRHRHPDAKLHWIIGADQLAQLPDWHQITEIARQVCFIVLQRPGYSLVPPVIPGLKLIKVEAPPMEHSSSQLRRRLSEGRSTEDWLSPAVEAFISSQGLYTRP